MNWLNRVFGKKSQDDKQLQHMVGALIRARTWVEAQPVIWKHPELLSREAIALIEKYSADAHIQNNLELENLLYERADWLRLCHEVGLTKISRVLAERKERSRTELRTQTEIQELELGELARNLTKRPATEIISLPKEEFSVEMPMPYVRWYATRLVCIPNVVDKGDGTKLCRTIGEQIYSKWGHNGMVKVCDFCRDQIGGDNYRAIEYAWDGIGEWRG